MTLHTFACKVSRAKLRAWEFKNNHRLAKDPNWDRQWHEILEGDVSDEAKKCPACRERGKTKDNP